MYRKNDQHLQKRLFSSLNTLPGKVQERLEQSWAGIFYDEFFCRLNEDRFAELYAEEPSRPNVPVNVLVGLEVLKAGHGWSDEEMYDAFCFDVQVRYALGYVELGEGHFDLRTMYNFRDRLSRHMQATGRNLLEEAFEAITDEQLAAFALKTGKQRMDSTQIASNIRQMSRVRLLVEVLQRVERILGEADREEYAPLLSPYLKGSAGQYVYQLKLGQAETALLEIGQVMQQLVEQLQPQYSLEAAYQVLERVFGEHFRLTASQVEAKSGPELRANSLQSPDDLEASYQEKGGKGYRGYVANLSETCDPDNDLQLVTKVQVAPNTTDDAALLAEALPELTNRMPVEEMYTDGTYSSPDVDQVMRAEQVIQKQTAIRGRAPNPDRLHLHDFDCQRSSEGVPEQITCLQGQTVSVQPGKQPDRFLAYFDQTTCAECPFQERCPTQPLQRRPKRVLRFSQAHSDRAVRRQTTQALCKEDRNLRAAVEASIRSLKHPFRQGKLPVRGLARVSMMVVAVTAMINIRRIWRSKAEKSAQNNAANPASAAFWLAWLTGFRRWAAWFRIFRLQLLCLPC